MATKKSSKAIVIALAAATGASVSSISAAEQQAMADMQEEFGKENVCAIEYTWDPFDGMYA